MPYIFIILLCIRSIGVRTGVAGYAIATPTATTVTNNYSFHSHFYFFLLTIPN